MNTENPNFTFLATWEDQILKLLTDTNPEEAAGIDNLSRRFFKNGAAVSVLPTSKLCNLSVKRSKFLLDCKVGKLKPLYKKSSNTNPEYITPFHFFHLFQKL